jgi:inosose dehydratase
MARSMRLKCFLFATLRPMDDVMSRQTRRQILQAASVAAAGVVCGKLPGAATAPEPALPRLGIQLYSLRGYQRDEALQHAHDLGFEEVELYGGMLATDAPDAEIAATQKKVADLGLSISAHGVNRMTQDVRVRKEAGPVLHHGRSGS